jgi:hypothetical protein
VHLLYTDEVNVDPTSTEFFIYGGVSVEGARAGDLSKAIDELRARCGYQPLDRLKFNTVERPAHVSPEVHKEIKRGLLELAASHGCKLFASFLLHKIARGGDVDLARRNEINRVCANFQAYLDSVRGHGLVLLDTFTDDQLSSHLRDKFSVGLTFEAGPSRLDRVLGFHLSQIGTSHFCSVVDVALGALRFAVNSRTEPTKREVGLTLLRLLAPMCIRQSTGYVEETSIFFSPRHVKVSTYRDKYVELGKWLQAGGINPQCAPV